MLKIEKEITRTIYSAKIKLSDGDKEILDKANEILNEIYETFYTLEDNDDVDGFDLEPDVHEILSEMNCRIEDIQRYM